MITIKTIQTPTILLYFILSFFKIYTQEVIADINYIGETVNKKEVTRNVNASNTQYEFQDIKRGVCIFHFPNREGAANDHKLISTGTIINTVKNSYNDDGSRTVLFLAAAHNLGNIFSSSTNDDNTIKVGDELTFYMSFDYESSRANEPLDNFEPYRTELSTIAIHKLWKTKLKVLVLDKDADIVLLELKFDNSLENISLDNHLAFFNTYALGWTLHPEIKNGSITNISHPRGDHKKIFQGKNKLRFFFLDENTYKKSKVPKKFIVFFENQWRNGAGKLRVGSSGSSLLDNNGKSFAVLHTLFSVWSPLENSWILSNDSPSNTSLGLGKYLDPDQTWISSVKGGYLKDLNKNPSDTDFDLTVTTNAKNAQIDLKGINFFNFFSNETTTDITLKDGLLPSTSYNSNKVILTVTPYERQDFLLYGSYYNDEVANNAPNNIIFKGEQWNPKTPYDNTIYSTNRHNNSRDIKNGILQYLKVLGETGPAFKALSTFNFKANIAIQTQSETEKIRAVKLPYMMPFNAVELFDEEQFDNLWRSYKYHDNKYNSDNLYINKIALKTKIVEDGNETILAEKSITTGNNGGYLNLVNPNYMFDVELSIEHTDSEGTMINLERYLDLDIFLNENYAGQVSYSVWIDYWNRDAYFLGKNPNNYTYNFVNDGPLGIIQHHSELFAQNTQTVTAGNPIHISEKIPNLGIGPNNSITGKKRMRIAVKEGGILPQQNDFSDTEYGAVEDYLINVKLPEPTTNEIKETLKETLKRLARLWSRRRYRNGDPPPSSGSGDGDNDIFDETPDSNDAPSGTTRTKSVTVGPCITSNSCGDLFQVDSNSAGGMYLSLSGYNNIAVDQNDDFIHEATNARTVFTTVNISSSNADSVIIYEEGGDDGSGSNDNNGFGIRLNQDGKVEFKVTINGSNYTIVSPSVAILDQWVNITAKFDSGKMTLYLDDVKQGVNTSFAENDITEIPQHTGDANWGGSNSSIFNDAINSNVTGALDELVIFDIPLSEQHIKTIGQNNTASSGYDARKISTADIKPKSSTKNTGSKNTESEKTYDFVIYPNPVKEQLNIIVEIQQAGVLNIEIFDLTGRNVYQINKPTISTGHQLITLKNLEIASGKYIINIEAGNISRSKQINFE